MKEKNINKKAYRQLAEYYDNLVDSIVLEKYKEVIGKAKGLDILDLGCGTGNLLKQYSSENNTYGIDQSSEMIKIARRKDKKSRYSVGDIRNFKLKEKFDIITCAFDTVNHLKGLKDWESLFKSVEKHLKDGGVFLFDFNTLEALKNYGSEAVFKKASSDYIILRTEVKKNICFWIIDIFMKDKCKSFKHKDIVIEERFYPEKTILQKVRKYFSIMKTFKNKDKRRMYLKVKKRKT